MLARFIRRVRSKPKAVRDQYAFMIAAGFTVLIGGVWLWQLTDRPPAEVLTDEPTTSSFSNIIDEAGDRLSNVTDVISSQTATSTNQSAEIDSLLNASSTNVIDLAATNATSSASTNPVSPISQPRTVRIATTSASTTP